MSLKISQIKDFKKTKRLFSSFSKLEVGGNFYIVGAMSLIFFPIFFCLCHGSSNIRIKTLICIHTMYFTEIQ